MKLIRMLNNLRLFRTLFIFILATIVNQLFSQEKDLNLQSEKARHLLKVRGELVFKFKKPAGYSLNYFSSFLSVDKYSHDTIYAYANPAGFSRFYRMNIPYKIITPPSMIRPIIGIEKIIGNGPVVQYPGYSAYLEIMENFVINYSNLCRLVEFGISNNNHRLLALKITDNPQVNETEPVVFLTSTMHGDEVLGYALMLRLIDKLLTNYNTDPFIKRLVDSIEIWINPLSNPDGTYFTSDLTVYGATRFNANGVDLNRDFPILQQFGNDSQGVFQSETQDMMDFMDNIQPSLCANFHGGAEVVNYPWDTWSRLHADDDWYQYISRAYADTVHKYGTAGYMTDLDNGITNGYAWYSVLGGRQDYTNYYLHSREVTIELSHEKMPEENTIDDYWEYNRQSLLNFIEESLYGITGIVSDSVSKLPLPAIINIAGHDCDNSCILSSAFDGSYYRYVAPGDYELTISSTGYNEKTLEASSTFRARTLLDVELSYPYKQYEIFPNPFVNNLNIFIPEAGGEMLTEIFDQTGRKVRSFKQEIFSAGKQDIPAGGLNKGVYFVRILYKNNVFSQVVIKQ